MSIVDELRTIGATSCRPLPDEARSALLEVTGKIPLEPLPDTYGPRSVRQLIEGARIWTPTGLLRDLADEFSQTLSEVVTRGGGQFANGKLNFNEITVQRYFVGALGIEPHRDPSCYENLLIVLVLSGKGTFAICKDNEGSVRQEFQTRAGDAILMRAPGFCGFTDRPIHTIRDITEDRFALILRERHD